MASKKPARPCVVARSRRGKLRRACRVLWLLLDCVVVVGVWVWVKDQAGFTLGIVGGRGGVGGFLVVEVGVVGGGFRVEVGVGFEFGGMGRVVVER